MYSEARGEPLEGVIAIAHAAVNRGNPCTISGVTRKPPPSSLVSYYRALARSVLTSEIDITKGADSWNTGNKPVYRGAIKRKVGRHVFYKMQ